MTERTPQQAPTTPAPHPSPLVSPQNTGWGDWGPAPSWVGYVVRVGRLYVNLAGGRGFFTDARIYPNYLQASMGARLHRGVVWSYGRAEQVEWAEQERGR